MDNGATFCSEPNRANFSTYVPVKGRYAYDGGQHRHAILGYGLVFRQVVQPNGTTATWSRKHYHCPTLPALVNGTEMQSSGDWISHGDDRGTVWTERKTRVQYTTIFVGGQEVVPGKIVIRSRKPTAEGLRQRRQPALANKATHKPVSAEFQRSTADKTVNQLLQLIRDGQLNSNETNYVRVQLANVGVITTEGERSQFMRYHSAFGFPSVRKTLAIADHYGIDLGPYAKIAAKSINTLLSHAHRELPRQRDRNTPKRRPKPFEHFACDTIGPYPASYFGNFKHAIVFVDVGSNSGYIIFLQSKTLNAVKDAAKLMIAILRRDLADAKVTNPTISIGPRLTSDGEKVLRHDQFNRVMAEVGFTTRDITAPYSAFYNGFIERFIGVNKPTVAALQRARNVPPEMWPDTWLHVVSTLHDLSPNRGNPDNSSPFFMRTRRQPSRELIQALRTPFWAPGARWTPKSARGALDTRGQFCRYVGFSRWARCHMVVAKSGTKWTRLHARHVQFDDTTIPPLVAAGHVTPNDDPGYPDIIKANKSLEQPWVVYAATTTTPIINGDVRPTFDPDWTDALPTTDEPDHATCATWLNDDETPEEQAFQCNITTSKQTIWYNIGAALNSEYGHIIRGDDPTAEPPCVKRERDGLIASGALSPPISRADIKPNERIIKLKGVYSVKFDEKHNPIRGKARYVYGVPGQRRGIDYYASSTHQETPAELRLVLGIQPPTPQKHKDANHDVKQAYTQATLNMVELPRGCRILVEFPSDVALRDVNGLPTVHSLLRWLYGMTGAGLAWEMTLFRWLEDQGWIQSIIAPCVWIRGDTRLDPETIRGAKTHSASWHAPDITRTTSPEKRRRIEVPTPHSWDLDRLSMMVIHTDDLKQRGPQDHLEKFAAELKARFPGATTSYGDGLYTGAFIQQKDDACYSMSTAHYIENIVKDHHLPKLKLRTTPLQPGINSAKLTATAEAVGAHDSMETDETPTDATTLNSDQTTRYRSILGSLGYPAILNRPDFAFAQSTLGQRQHNPTTADEAQLMHYLGYAYAARNKKLQWTLQPADKANQLEGTFDASVANCAGGRSQIGYIITMNGGPIAWSSRKNPTVNLSTNSSETYAGADAVEDIVYLRNVLDFLGYGQKLPTPLGTDSSGALTFLDSEKVNATTRSWSTRVHYIREKCSDGTVVTYKIHTDHNPSDITTKSTFRWKHAQHAGKLVYAVWMADVADGDKPNPADLTTDELTALIVTDNINDVPKGLESYAMTPEVWIQIRDSLVYD